MSESQISKDIPTAEEMTTALFAHLVMQQSNMAMMLLGKVAHPETGKTIKDLEAAKLFIDQLEMLETRTKGNLNKDEATLLKQNLMNLRLAFVEAVESPSPAQARADSSNKETTPAEPGKTGQATQTAPEGASSSAADDEHRKKFTKKY
jgi:hypothetical protein